MERRPCCPARHKIFLPFLATVFFGVVTYLLHFLANTSVPRYHKFEEGPYRVRAVDSQQEKDYTIFIWLPRRIKEGEDQEPGGESSPSIPWSRDTWPKRGSPELVSAVTEVHQELPTKRLPQALIIGVKKSGTRALLEFLRLHPDIRAAGPETHFFDRFYQRGLHWYREQMPPSLQGQITMEKTPSYFITREVPQRIHSMSSSVKLIVVVRDPVTRAISDYTQTASKRRGTLSFEELAFQNASTGLVDTSWSAIRIGVYARYVDWWLAFFKLEQIHFVNGETLVQNPAKEMARLQDFLGLRRVVNEKHFYYNETKGFPCLRKKSEDNENIHCLGKNKGRSHPNIPSGTIQRLRDFFRPFNVKFYKMVGVDFGWP